MTVQEEIEKLRSGGSYIGDIRSFVEPSSFAIGELALELRQNPSPKMRGEIVKLLVHVGTEADPHRSLRNRKILSALLYDAALIRDKAFSDALEKIAQLAAPGILQEYGQTIAGLLSEAPEPALFLVVAKAKAVEALPILQELGKDPRWAEDDNFRIALAALGDQAEEDAFVERFAKATDARDKIEAAKPLGRIGTRTSLEALAREMRSPMVVEVPGSYRMSVRPDIAKAIHSCHPEKTFFLEIGTDSDYERIERFCEIEYGIQWSRPRPPFLVFSPTVPPG